MSYFSIDDILKIQSDLTTLGVERIDELDEILHDRLTDTVHDRVCTCLDAFLPTNKRSEKLLELLDAIVEPVSNELWGRQDFSDASIGELVVNKSKYEVERACGSDVRRHLAHQLLPEARSYLYRRVNELVGYNMDVANKISDAHADAFAEEMAEHRFALLASTTDPDDSLMARADERIHAHIKEHYPHAQRNDSVIGDLLKPTPIKPSLER